MTADRDYLFVYGTLLSRDIAPTGRTQRVRLAREATVIGPATTEGRLVNLGRYPGLIVPAAGEIVHGELLELTVAARTLRWLDVFEGIVPGQHAHNEYVRTRRGVEPERGAAVQAWVYVYQGPLTEAKPIADGRWLGA